ncbi:MAG: dockerin type I domain-containing protein [Planctomycetota bacterium]|nr:dockerin type I domain-containing protein [Planctomycetota bacterium]
MASLLSILRRGAVSAITTAACLYGSTSLADDMPPAGMFIWFDQPVWCAPDSSDLNANCFDAEGDYKWGPNILCKNGVDAYSAVAQMAANNDSAIPSNAMIMGGSVFIIAETLAPDFPECKPWDDPTLPINLNTTCYANDVAAFREDSYTAHAAFIEGLKNSNGTQIPVSLMCSCERSLRWGRWLSTHVDSDGTSFGGLTEMGNPDCPSDINDACDGDDLVAPCDCGYTELGVWSKHWPFNATHSMVDDYDMVINYTNRIIDFTSWCQDKIKGGNLNFGPKPVLDVYLDLELFQLSKVQPIANANVTIGTNVFAQYGCYLPGSENMRPECRDHVVGNSNASQPNEQVVGYWQVPASVADSFWRTLRAAKAKIEAHNNNVSDEDWNNGTGIKLTLSVWAQEAYRWVSPRFAIKDTSTDSSAFNNNASTPGYSMFHSPFGSAEVNRGAGQVEDWSCDCCTLSGDGDGQTTDGTYQSTVIDDFTILNCMYKYADRVAFGTYQNVPAAIDKVSDKHYPGRLSMAVDFVGEHGSNNNAFGDWYPGDKVPTIMNTPIDFTRIGISELDDIYRYNPSGAWPPNATPGHPTPDWGGESASLCDSYWGYWDMSVIPSTGDELNLIPTRGWVPYAGRFLRSMHRWKSHPNNSNNSIKGVMTLENTALDGYNSGGGGCYLTSLANTWVWGSDDSTDAAPCLADPVTAPLCPEDRTLYVVGGHANATTSQGYPVGNAWGLRPAWRLFSTTPANDNGSGNVMLSDYLDSTPFAMNNQFSFRCLVTTDHEATQGYYYKNHCGDVNWPAECLDPYWVMPGSPDCLSYKSCQVPGTHVRQTNVANFMLHRGVRGDVNDDLTVNIDDLLSIIRLWGEQCNGPCRYDHDGDGEIDVNDLLFVINHWGS